MPGVADVWAALELGEEPPGLLYAVNRATPTRRRGARRGRRGGADPARLRRAFRLSERAALARRGRAEVPATRRARSRPSSARPATARAAGTVLCLEYEAYEGMAEDGWRDRGRARGAARAVDVAIHHRVGGVGIGEPSVVIAVSSPTGRRARRLQGGDRHTQGTVPLWKKEVYEGGEEWIGQGS